MLREIYRFLNDLAYFHDHNYINVKITSYTERARFSK